MSQSEEEPGNGHDVGDLLDVLSSPLDDGDGFTAVLTRRPRVKLPSLTLALAVIVVASAGFVGGIAVGKHYGSSGSASGSPASGFSRFPAGASPPAGLGSGSGAGLGGGGGGFAGGNATIGTIKLIDGSTVYVQTSSGGIVQVFDVGRNEGDGQFHRPGQGPSAGRDGHRRR